MEIQEPSDGSVELASWADVDPLLKQYVYDLLNADLADLTIRLRAGMLSIGATAVSLDEMLDQLDVHGEAERARFADAFRTMQMPAPTLIVRFTTASTEAWKFLRGEESRWLELPVEDQDVVIAKLGVRCADADFEAIENLAARALVVRTAQECCQVLPAEARAAFTVNFNTAVAANQMVFVKARAIACAIRTLEDDDT